MLILRKDQNVLMAITTVATTTFVRFIAMVGRPKTPAHLCLLIYIKIYLSEPEPEPEPGAEAEVE